MRGRHLTKHWSTTQQLIALISGEAELMGIIKGATEGIGLKSAGRDLDIDNCVLLYIGSSAAMGMVARKGVGRVRHIDVGDLRSQDALKHGVLSTHKVKGEDNPTDILTKHVERGKIHQHCHAMGLAPESGRTESATATIVSYMLLIYFRGCFLYSVDSADHLL